MANYSYQSASYGSSGGGGASAVADSEFQQADSNSDGRLDIGEFRRFIGKVVPVVLHACSEDTF